MQCIVTSSFVTSESSEKIKHNLWRYQDVIFSLFQEEISVCAAAHTFYVMDTCDHVRSIILLPPIMGMSLVLVTLTKLIPSEPEHWVTWPHRIGVKEKNPILQCFYLTTSFLTHFYLWCKLHQKNQEFLLLLKRFLRNK